jgi:hypothetical protein
MSTQTSTIELRATAGTGTGTGTASGSEGFQDGVEDGTVAPGDRHEFPVLPPVDGGKDAWLFLGACFVIEALVWGMCFLRPKISIR